MKITDDHKTNMYRLFKQGHDWTYIADKYREEFGVDKKNLKSFTLRISRNFQGKRGLQYKKVIADDTLYVVEIICHKMTPYGTRLFLCKYVGFELNEKTDWTHEEDMNC